MFGAQIIAINAGDIHLGLTSMAMSFKSTVTVDIWGSVEGKRLISEVLQHLVLEERKKALGTIDSLSDLFHLA